ncbi:twin-arginine translocase TatA/TatE family subunit [Paenibacillus sp. IB182496]|uniref:Sec-independent protein translocase protein TatA n=1 Tax=Paenibacillus sabuli TaxID=2772509 RepID=A0A927GQN2_9BACL|nr:twin-arginine translocase TatA/TatE family subunit [Paenibacillus sabuli]MBD2843947.1 twin-arginine translocase TatA/TatE family subunit [Paenibacillus sabuli]
MLNNIGVSGLAIILLIALIVFGPAKLPQLGRAFGDTLREFRNSTKGIADEDGAREREEVREDVREPRKLIE